MRHTVGQKMKTLLLTTFLAIQTLSVFSQDALDSLIDENLKWLRTLKNADKNEQLTLIRNRLVSQLDNTDKGDIPLLIVDGVPVSADDKIIEFFLDNLTSDKVDIKVLDKEPEGLYINKRFTGLIAITITDKRTRKKFKQLD